jgi:hypothetical protein
MKKGSIDRELTPTQKIERDFELMLIGMPNDYQPKSIVVNMAYPIMEMCRANNIAEIPMLKLMVLEYHKRFNERYADEVEQLRTTVRASVIDDYRHRFGNFLEEV